MDRVEEVVDWALTRGFWNVLNFHHDSWKWADLTIENDTLEERKRKIEALWVQIADRFKWKQEKLIFEPLNEPAGSSSQKNAEQYNDANQRFVDIVRNSGGYNKDRLLTIPGLNTNIQRTVDWFREPVGVGNYILHVHDYDPWPFVSASWGRTFWGTQADKDEIEKTFIALQNCFQAPALIGEWGFTSTSIELGASWRYFDFFVRTSAKYQLASQLWDNGNDHFDRAARKWRDPVKLEIIHNAIKGVNNSLPSYNQEPKLYFSVDTKSAPVGDRAFAIDWNGNTLREIRLGSTSGRALRKGKDYTITSSGITISSTYLTSLLSTYPADTLGPLTTLHPIFSKGISFPVSLVRSGVPVVPDGHKKITVSDTSSSLLIPVDWKGTQLATVKAMKRDGGILKDDWTIGLGPLEQGRLNWGDFDTVANGVTIGSVVLGLVKSAGQEVDFTLEFWPRAERNSVTVTVTAA